MSLAECAAKATEGMVHLQYFAAKQEKDPSKFTSEDAADLKGWERVLTVIGSQLAVLQEFKDINKKAKDAALKKANNPAWQVILFAVAANPFGIPTGAAESSSNAMDFAQKMNEASQRHAYTINAFDVKNQADNSPKEINIYAATSIASHVFEMYPNLTLEQRLIALGKMTPEELSKTYEAQLRGTYLHELLHDTSLGFLFMGFPGIMSDMAAVVEHGNKDGKGGLTEIMAKLTGEQIDGQDFKSADKGTSLLYVSAAGMFDLMDMITTPKSGGVGPK